MVLMVGRIDFGKGIQYLPRLVRNLVRDFPELKLEIAGQDSYARGIGSLKNWLCQELGDLQNHVSFLGQLDKEALEKAYARAWVVIIPSRWDNFPTVLLEAMSLGKPVVASPHGGMPEMLEDTECQTAEPDSQDFSERVRLYLVDESARRRAGQSMLRKATSVYSPNRIAEEYVKLITASLHVPE